MVVDAEVMLEPHHGRASAAHLRGAAGDEEALVLALAGAKDAVALRGRGGKEMMVAKAEREECHGTGSRAAAAAAIGGGGVGIRRAGLARAHGEVVAEDGRACSATARRWGEREICGPAARCVFCGGPARVVSRRGVSHNRAQERRRGRERAAAFVCQAADRIRGTTHVVSRRRGKAFTASSVNPFHQTMK